MAEIGGFKNAAQGAERVAGSQGADVLNPAKLKKAARALIVTIVNLIKNAEVKKGAKIKLDAGEDGCIKILVNGKPCISAAIKKAIAVLSKNPEISRQCLDYIINNVQNKPFMRDFLEVEAGGLLKLSSAPLKDMKDIKQIKTLMVKNAAGNIIALSRYDRRQALIILDEYFKLPEVMRNVAINDYVGMPKISVSIGKFIRAVESEGDSIEYLKGTAERVRMKFTAKFMDTVHSMISADASKLTAGAPKAGEEVKAAQGAVARKIQGFGKTGKAAKGALKRFWEGAVEMFFKLIKRAH